VIAIETLSVASMLKYPRGAIAVQAQWYGRTLIGIHRWFRPVGDVRTLAYRGEAAAIGSRMEVPGMRVHP
jgi:hypothetical protein